jgi:hypothetical protein
MPPVRIVGVACAAPLLPLYSSSRTRSHSALTHARLCTLSHRLSPTALATVVAVVRKHWSSTITACHHPQVKPPASVTVRPTTPATSSSMWSSPCIAASDPPLTKQPTPRAPPGYHAPPHPVSWPPRPPYRTAVDVLPCSDRRHRGATPPRCTSNRIPSRRASSSC